jgi:hypothetical protein
MRDLSIVRTVESIIAEVKPARKIDLIRCVWGDIQKLRAARLTHKQTVAQLPKLGIHGIGYGEFRHICYRIRKEHADTAASSVRRIATTPPDFDPLEDAKRRREEKTKPIFQQSKEG